MPDWSPFGMSIFCLTARIQLPPSGDPSHLQSWWSSRALHQAGSGSPFCVLKADLEPYERNSVIPFLWGLGYCQTHPSKIVIGIKLLTLADFFSFQPPSYVLSMGNFFISHLQGAISMTPCSLLLYYDYVRNMFLALLKINMLWKIFQNQWYRWQSLYDRRKEKLHNYNFFPAISTDKCCWQNSKNFNCS